MVASTWAGGLWAFGAGGGAGGDGRAVAGGRGVRARITSATSRPVLAHRAGVAWAHLHVARRVASAVAAGEAPQPLSSALDPRVLASAAHAHATASRPPRGRHTLLEGEVGVMAARALACAATEVVLIGRSMMLGEVSRRFDTPGLLASSVPGVPRTCPRSQLRAGTRRGGSWRVPGSVAGRVAMARSGDSRTCEGRSFKVAGVLDGARPMP